MSFTIGGGINLEKCYSNLLASDINSDGYISQSEFVTYLQTSATSGALDTNQFGGPLTTFSMLPQSFVGVYNFFACGDEFVGCPSVIGIDVRGLQELNSSDSSMGVEVQLSAQETTFLYRLCKDTEEVVEEYEESLVVDNATESPTGVPTVEVTEVISFPTSSPMSVVAAVPTPSPTSESTLISTSTPLCPPQYVPGESYQAEDLVSNQIYDDSSSSIPYFKCRPFPFAAWCSQAAYEPGVTLAWEEAWELIGVCDNGGVVVTTDPATTMGTSATTTNVIGSTSSTVASTTITSATLPATPPTPVIFTTNEPSNRPTSVNPEDIPTSGPLPVQFQYEIGNDQNLVAESILSESNPANNMIKYLEDGTDTFVATVISETFGISSSEGNGGSIARNGNNVRRRRRKLEVTYDTSSVSISDIRDIACSYPTMTSESRCQKVTAGMTLELRNEPPLTTNLRFQSGVIRGIDEGLLTFPPESGIVYVGETRSVQVIPEFGANKDIENIGGGGDGGNSSNNKWVVPLSVVVAVSLAAVLILFSAIRLRKRQQEGKEFDGVEEVSLEEGEDMENDLSPGIFSNIYNPFRAKRQKSAFDEAIDETPNVNDSGSGSGSSSGSDLIDLEQGETIKPQQHHGRNPFDSSSSSGSSSSASEEMHQRRTSSKGLPLPSWKEVSEDDLNKSGEVGELYMRERESSDYRAGVEALVREACPEHIDDVDDMMAEYEGREAVLIGQLSVMLANQKERKQNESSSTMDSPEKRRSNKDSRLKAVLESGAELMDSKSYDESSAAGSSEWSTDDGMSSIDASMSASSSEREMLPDTYAAIGDAALTINDSNLRTTTFIQVDNTESEFPGINTPPPESKHIPKGDQPITKEDLDAAIEAGDWNAVGATASLLARDAMGRRGSESEQSSVQSDHSLSSMEYSDKDRAQEFERLIEAGDWKAVMEIASEFEGAGRSESFNFSKLSEMDFNDSRRLSSTSDILGKNDQGLSKREEIEELVKRVVPDEFENIDEMLSQFKGRENELIMTLRTMDERNQNSSSSMSSPEGSKSSSATSPNQSLKHVNSFQEDTVFEGD